MEYMNKLIFNSSHPAIKHLTAQEDNISQLISMIGDYTLELRTDYYSSLIRGIIGQQISSMVAQTIWTRVTNLCIGAISPSKMIQLTEVELKSIGISTPKIRYIANLNHAIQSGVLNLEMFNNMSDNDVLNTLTQIKGIGFWTAKMFLIFSLGRLNVLAENDVGLQRAATWLYCKPVDSAALNSQANNWLPYRSVASLYLWEVVNRGYILSPCCFPNRYQKQ
jgi:DNA-3-methyladenine glycosylase II